MKYKNRKIMTTLLTLAVHMSALANMRYADVNVTVNQDAKIKAKPISGCEIDTVVEFDIIAGESRNIRLPISAPTAIEQLQGNLQNKNVHISMQNSNITISAEQFREGGYSLYAVNGREILKGDISPLGKATLPLSSVAHGVYVLKIYKNGKMISAKIRNHPSLNGVVNSAVKTGIKSSISSAPISYDMVHKI